MKKFVRVCIPFGLLFILLYVDRATKYAAQLELMGKDDFILIPGILRLHYLENRGAAWGMLQGKLGVFSIVTVIVLCAIVICYIRIPEGKRYLPLQFTLILLSAGALGNFVDRVTRQYVVDFIYVEAIHFPVFNVADIYVCVSAVLLLYLIIFHYKEEELSWKKK